jgi:hypothetical protein
MQPISESPSVLLPIRSAAQILPLYLRDSWAQCWHRSIFELFDNHSVGSLSLFDIHVLTTGVPSEATARPPLMVATLIVRVGTWGRVLKVNLLLLLGSTRHVSKVPSASTLPRPSLGQQSSLRLKQSIIGVVAELLHANFV